MKPRITIIVPVYKVEKYLEKCVESVINQTYKNIEIILVNDGSPDNCPYICDKYARKDQRIKVIHKKNGGLSDARNVGLDEAKGEYVLFVDSDDYIELNSCEKFIDIIGNKSPDIVVGNAKRLENNKIYYMKHRLNTGRHTINGKKFLETELKAGTMYMAAWLNLYRKSFLLDNKLKFSVGLLHEDEEFTPRAFLKADSVMSTDLDFYNYIIRENSITTRKNKIKNAEHLIKIYRSLGEIYKDIQEPELRKMLNDSLVDKYLNTFQVAKLYKKEYSYLVDKKFLIGKSATIKNKLKVSLFYINKYLYYYINEIEKKIKNT